MGREVEMKLHIKSCIIDWLAGISNFCNSQYNSLIPILLLFSSSNSTIKALAFFLLVPYFYCNWFKKFFI